MDNKEVDLVNNNINYKNVAIVVLFVCVFVFTQLSIRYVTDVARKENLTVPLPDLYHQALPEYMRDWHEYSDWVPIIPLTMFVLMDKGRNSFDFLLLIGIIYLLRAMAYSMTVLPSPSIHCKCEWEDEPNTFLRSMLNLLYQEGCNDLIFSGHTSMMVMSSLFLCYYCLNKSVLSQLLLVVYNIIGFIIIIGTRLHYSVDVFIATVITVLLFFSFQK
jgi:hypothetical protein